MCYVTWLDVGVFNSVALPGQSMHTMQCVIYEATGVVEYRYESMPTSSLNATLWEACISWAA